MRQERCEPARERRIALFQSDRQQQHTCQSGFPIRPERGFCESSVPILACRTEQNVWQQADDAAYAVARVITIIIDNFCIALFSGVHKLTALYNILQHYLSEKKIEGILFQAVIHL